MSTRAWTDVSQDWPCADLAGATILVCGCGPSLNALPLPPPCLTIGVNDIGRRFDPDYLVVLNPPGQFTAGRFRHVEASRARAVFSQLPLRLAHAPLVRIRLGQRGGTDWRDPKGLPYTRNSPYVALCLALQTGARRIGLLGVDFTGDHFFGPTGPHPLARELARADAEYGALARAALAEGIEILNLSDCSRLASLPRQSLDRFLAEAAATAHAAAALSPSAPGPPPHVPAGPSPVPEPEQAMPAGGPRVFFVHYRFLACGEVFTDGLRRAAARRGLPSEHAHWDDPRLPERIARFAPDLLFVVHGRNFVRHWGTRFSGYRSAVWLLDEPYEVDDSARYARGFGTVFLNDPATLPRHQNGHYLPVCYDPQVHVPGSTARRHRVGFIGGGNPSREALLVALAQRGLLGYVVGGPWRDARLRALCLAPNCPTERTAELYRDTALVVNVFRDRHHFNRAGIVGTAMNPRIYEALACGALVLSERRAEIAERLPELPCFDTVQDAVALVERLVANPAECDRLRAACFARLRDDTYEERLRQALDLALGARRDTPGPARACGPALPAPAAMPPEDPPVQEMIRAFDEDWEDCGGVVSREANGEILIRPQGLPGPGAERGLASRARYHAVQLEFEVRIEAGACFLAKLHQVDRLDQATNSYHLLCDPGRAYLARHHHVFGHVPLAREAWQRVRLSCAQGALFLHLDDRPVLQVQDRLLAGGFAFLGAQAGPVRLRAVRLTVPGALRPVRDQPEAGLAVLQPVAVPQPRVSIVTTVYDRVECLRQCIASVQRLEFQDYEHIIVSDSPPPEVVRQLAAIVAAARDARIGHFNLARRHNNWGIAPAAVGLRQARGEYLCFLSDDNGYTPDHIGNLVRILDRDPRLGFAYSSCRYAGRLILRDRVPRPARIDLGQPLFRRELFRQHFSDDLPFDIMAWDWQMIEALMARGVRWMHFDRPSFIFRLAQYPQLMAALEPAG